MHVLVCGGAGYIGSHTCYALHRAGHKVTVFDNLSTGHAESVRWGALHRGDLLDPASLDAVLSQGDVDAVMHFSALSIVSESMREPDRYFRNNVEGTANLLTAMRKHGVRRLVFSSTAATYGNPQTPLIDESHPTQPINPYGESKIAAERLLQQAALDGDLDSVALRYFNAAGAAPAERIGESHDPETHLIPNVLKSALGTGPTLTVFGTDYPTPDGTCVRDYIHVVDLADAHIRALHYLDRTAGHHVFNLGTSTGNSVMEVIEQARDVTGVGMAFEMQGRREGDPAVLVASNAKAKAELGWTPQRDLRHIIADAWSWHRDPAF